MLFPTVASRPLLAVVRTLFLLMLFVCLLLPSLATASVEPCPLVTDRTINGVWEAIYTDDTIRVFRLELREDGISVLAQGLAHDRTFVSVLEERSIIDGKLNLLFRNSGESRDILVRGEPYKTTGKELLTGEGRVCAQKARNSGVLDTTLIMEPDSPSPKKWKLRFIQVEGQTLSDLIHQMSDSAEKAAHEQQKR